MNTAHARTLTRTQQAVLPDDGETSEAPPSDFGRDRPLRANSARLLRRVPTTEVTLRNARDAIDESERLLEEVRERLRRPTVPRMLGTL